MIRWKGRSPGGRALLGFGLEADNLERLKQDDPIIVDGEPMGLACDILIYFIKDIKAEVERIKKNGTPNMQMNLTMGEHGADPCLVQEVSHATLGACIMALLLAEGVPEEEARAISDGSVQSPRFLEATRKVASILLTLKASGAMQ